MTGLPEPDFWVLGAEPVRRAAVPTLAFKMRANNTSGREVYAIVLTAQIQIEAAQRTYSEETRERLREIFGEPERWGDTARGVLWTREEHLVQGFADSVRFDIRVPLTIDAEIAAVKYFSAVQGGKVPLTFHFSGTVMYRGETDRLQITQLAWTSEAKFELPIETWRQTIALHYPEGGVMRLGEATLEELRAFRVARGLPSLEAAVHELLEAARAEV